MVGIDIISERIASMRQRRNMTLKELAEQIGVSESTAHRYETGHSRIMYPKVVALAKEPSLNKSVIHKSDTMVFYTICQEGYHGRSDTRNQPG